MGTALYERGIFVNRNFEEVCLNQPELVYQVHREYLLAGAHILEINSYGANKIRLAKFGLAEKFVAINQKSVEIAKRAADGAAYICGSIGSTGLTASQLRRIEEEVIAAYAEQAQILADGGCDALIIETFSQPSEMRLAVLGARSVTDIPIIAQIAVTDEGGIADNTDPLDLALEMKEWGVNVVGANCSGPDEVFQVATRMAESKLPICVMPNAGRPKRLEDRQIYLATAENFGVFARRMYKAGIKIVGGCCGTDPEYVKRIASASRMVSPRRIELKPVEEAAETQQDSIALSERSNLGKQLGERFVFSVEVNPATGLSTEKPVNAARMLTASGADFINIADGPRATVRMSNLALGLEMQRELDIEVLLHVCCRDRNLLGLQSFMLGSHVMGVRNVVVITGDPPKVGDYPDATGVYDVDSIGLLNIIDGYNRGVDPAGKPMAERTSFVMATGAEPAAIDFEREMLRLGQKVQAGANLIMTQPIYDPTQLNRFLEATSAFDIPVMVGILPLASYRNAEFIHNYIPGMSIPEDIRDRMKKSGKGDSARREGIQIAMEALEGVRDRVAGAYIMPPLGRYEMAAEIISQFGDDRSLGKNVPGCAA
jgi:homocysteine S-methyltransferase